MFWAASRLLLLLVVAAVLTGLYMRIIGHDPARWHVDPATVQLSGKPNDHLIAGADAVTLDAPPQRVAAALHEIALAEPGTRLIAGSPGEAWMTYVVTSRLMGFPDYVSVRVEPQGGGSRLSAYSRARIGYSDMGVNRARLERWIAALRQRVDE